MTELLAMNMLKSWTGTVSRRIPIVSPLNSYEPHNAIQINKLNGRGAINADNYVWFTMDARVRPLISAATIRVLRREDNAR